MKATVTIELPCLSNTVFIVMPFSQLYQIQYEKVIKPAIEESGLLCVRGDEIYTKQRIMDDIWNSIRNCRFVIAELTGRNPNVLYEVGLAHAIGKPVIIITRNSDDVPFDLTALRYLFYDTNDPFWGPNLKEGLQSLLVKIIDNPEIDKYLDGIKSSKFRFPDVEKNKIAGEIADDKLPNLSGNWKGVFVNAIKNTHDITVHISQKGTDVSGLAIISFKIFEELTVIQEYFNGIIGHDKISFTGVNYGYVQRGNSPGYNLDFFTMRLGENNNELWGEVVDGTKGENNVTGEIRLERIS